MFYEGAIPPWPYPSTDTIQFNCVKEMLLPDVAEAFQSLGLNAFIYDPRSIGDSDGIPKNQIDPLQQVEDLSGMTQCKA